MPFRRSDAPSRLITAMSPSSDTLTSLTVRASTCTSWSRMISVGSVTSQIYEWPSPPQVPVDRVVASVGALPDPQVRGMTVEHLASTEHLYVPPHVTGLDDDRLGGGVRTRGGNDCERARAFGDETTVFGDLGGGAGPRWMDGAVSPATPKLNRHSTQGQSAGVPRGRREPHHVARPRHVRAGL